MLFALETEQVSICKFMLEKKKTENYIEIVGEKNKLEHTYIDCTLMHFIAFQKLLRLWILIL